jgi:hypothetical protein
VVQLGDAGGREEDAVTCVGFSPMVRTHDALPPNLSSSLFSTLPTSLSWKPSLALAIPFYTSTHQTICITNSRVHSISKKHKSLLLLSQTNSNTGGKVTLFATRRIYTFVCPRVYSTSALKSTCMHCIRQSFSLPRALSFLVMRLRQHATCRVSVLTPIPSSSHL